MMKALILAAGFGTRLLPYTKTIPKPLFTLNNIPMIGHSIQALERIGCDHILINTHYLHDKIADFINTHEFKANIQILHEPDILDTGGAIANAKPFLKNAPFIVINADIICSANLKKIYNAHIQSGCMASLVLHDCAEFNKILVDTNGFIKGFDMGSNGLAFTGIQVLSPDIFKHFPNVSSFSSIFVYKSLCDMNQVKAWIEKDLFWSDIGTLDAYSKTSLLTLVAQTFEIRQEKIPSITILPLAGDGSDRQWYRASFEDQTCIISDHGICMPGTDKRRGLDAFVNIGRHLKTKKISVPDIYHQDRLSGMVTLEDLGDTHLQTVITHKNNALFTLNTYKTIIDHLICFSQNGINDFNIDWTCQTSSYSKKIIIEKECCYFMEAFINGYLEKNIEIGRYMDEFNFIADQAQKNAIIGLMHRDFQSRNIMIKNDQPFFIDFQSARMGPLQYDLASLLIDPYVNLNAGIQQDLLNYTIQMLKLEPTQEQLFLKNYNYCCLTRNLQMLGAFGFLTRIKKKPGFEPYIPNAVDSLKRRIKDLKNQGIPILSNLVHTL
ncbi:MAG: sugar phosphate nucleotidyltransferase [Pseudomonadota bacterium]